MPYGVAPLPDEEYALMGYSDHNAFYDSVNAIQDAQQRFVTNATHRLADVYWLSQTLDQQVKLRQGPAVTEGLLSLQMYLLLTCADTLGHVSRPKDTPKGRFDAFFRDLPLSAQQSLVASFLVWKTTWEELIAQGLADPQTSNVTLPSQERIVEAVSGLSHNARLRAVSDFLYRIRRNPYTHEADYPQLGLHPNLSVLQMLRLGVDSVATFPRYDRIQFSVDGETWFFVFFGADDPIAALRETVLQGLGAIVRSMQPGRG